MTDEASPGAINYDPVLEWIDRRVVDDSRRVVLTFLLVSGVFALGLGNVSTAAGTSQFTTGLPSEEALQDVNREFGTTFAADTGSTQLIQHNTNVLSRPAMLRMLEVQERLEDTDGLRVTSTASAAGIVAQQLDPTATTTGAQIDAIEGATATEIDVAVRAAARENSRFTGLLSTDFNRKSASASATIGTATHEVPAGVATGAGQSGSSPLTPLQQRAQRVVGSVGGDITVFGGGLIAAEFSTVIIDSLLIVVPAAVLFILLFLSFAYRDLADMLLGMVALLLAIVWTFGFMGLAGIAFSQMLIAVPPLLLAVGIDFGIHAVNRFREERERGLSIDDSMRETTDQLTVAFFIVTGTTVIGFAANFTSALAPIRDFGFVAGIGIVFTFLLFGIFLPAAKVELDRLRARYPIPTFSTRPLGSAESPLGRVLQGGVVVAKRVPRAFLLLVLVTSLVGGYYATGVDTTFSQEDFLPPEETPEFLLDLPEPFRPSEYTVTAQLNFLEAKFASTQSSQAIMYVQGPMERDHALESLHRAGADPPDSFVSDGRQADGQSIIAVIQARSAADPEFRRLVARNDRNGNGIPDDNLGRIYDELEASPSASQAGRYLADDRRSAKLVYSVESDATQREVEQDARAVAGDVRFETIPTGQTIVFQAVSDIILESALVSLVTALIGAGSFLVFIYWALEGSASLGIANLVPILVTVTAIAATMRWLGISFNALTATILAITIGLGIDYSVHVTHRFADERRVADLSTALDRTVRGTGGALAGSMLTTVSGIGVLALALFPAIGQFGVLTALSVFYSFVASLVVLPSALVVWDGLVDGTRETATDASAGPRPVPDET
jgi:predicted RND superfamily exporter protein